ncbi:MAG: replicative DNA helicase [Deltaproteobacteria bacterium]|nr:MAG: replicative DNA helicase [Deltaproteobacteria bacterium]
MHHSGREASVNGSKSAPPGGNDASLRVPPHNLHAEQAVLASVLLNNDLMSDVVEVLRPDDFYQGAHRTLYEAMLGLYEGGRPIDHLTLSAVIRDRGAEQQIGGLAYLAEIVSTVPLSANAAEYAVIVKEKSILRKSIVAAQEISTSAFQGVGDIREFLDRMEERIFAISGEEIKPKYFSMNEMARAALKDIEKAYEQKKRITGIPSGFRDLDEVTAGFQKSNMIVVAARPAMGKTSLCLNIAVSAAIRHKVPVAIFSLEMSRQELAMRMICSEARVNFQRLRTGQIGQEEINRLVASVAKLSDAPIYTDDSGALSALDLRARARRLKKDKDVGLIIIDYLQLMRGSAARSNPDNRVQEVSEISRSMKALAKELDIPVIAISQLSRGVENRSDKRPQMADLRESGAIEQDSDLILFVYREEMYSKDKTPQEEKGVAEIIVGKNRSGPMRDVKLAFLAQFTRFEDLAQDFE